jgi:L-aspartate oxidase
VTDLVVRNGACVGIELLGGERIDADNVTLACGGAGQLFSRTTNPLVSTGDGVALALRAGAAVADMEFFQFHPTAFALEGSQRFLISEAVRGHGAVLRNHAGERFMLDLHPRAELAPRDIVARGIAMEMERHGLGHVWLDATAFPGGEFAVRFPTIYGYCRDHGIDPERDFIPVAPAAHYMMGGIWTDTWGRTTLPGLFACGETASTGVHGANRLASNSLLEGVVFGARVAEALGSGPWTVERALDSVAALSQPTALAAAPLATRAELQDLMWRNVGIVRDGAGLRVATARLAASATAATQSEHDIETANLAITGWAVAEAALRREESRGAHYRTDFPVTRREWQRRQVFRLAGAAVVPPAAAVV